MADEIKEGDYIRTDKGYIGKVTYVREKAKMVSTDIDKEYIDTDYTYGIGFVEIVKHSKNIIDLIEVGDYVNGYKVSDKESTLLITKVKGIDRSGYHIPISQYGDGIKSIVTKEQFESVKYNV